MHSMSSNWTKREASMEFPYTKELGVTTLQTTATVIRSKTDDEALTFKKNYLFKRPKTNSYKELHKNVWLQSCY